MVTGGISKKAGICLVEFQRLDKQFDGPQTRLRSSSPFKITNGTHAQCRPVRQFLLSQPRGLPVADKQAAYRIAALNVTGLQLNVTGLHESTPDRQTICPVGDSAGSAGQAARSTS